MSRETAGPVASRRSKVGLALASFLITCLMLELGTRASKWEWRGENFLVGELTWFWAAFPTQYDSELGWAPRPGASTLDGSWGTQVTVLETGVRSNGAGSPPPAEATPIVAVGDSFTWGAEVSDSETWPAQLEQRLARPVINGGVFGYGVDQSYLRALQLIKRFDPELVVFSFILDDVTRCEQSVRAGTSKPYFSHEGDGLKVHRPDPEPEGDRIGTLRRLSGYSFFVYKLLRRTVPGAYLAGGLDATVQPGAGPKIACRLLAQLADLAERNEMRLLIVLQGGGPIDPADGAGVYERLTCLREDPPAPVLDLRAELTAMAAEEPDRYGRFFTRHMTAEGNSWVAARIAAALPVQ